MPLSDDALNNWEQMATQACEAPPFMGRNNTKLYAAMVLDLVPELRAARKVVEAARAFMDAGPSVAYYNAGLGLPFGDGPDWEGDLKNALAEYDTASAEPQEAHNAIER